MGQITVFSGPERRRRWSEDERLEILAETFSTGACVAQVARRHDVSTGLIYTWRRKLYQPVAEPGFAEAVVVDKGGAERRIDPPAIIVELARGSRGPLPVHDVNHASKFHKEINHIRLSPRDGSPRNLACRAAMGHPGRRPGVNYLQAIGTVI